MRLTNRQLQAVVYAATSAIHSTRLFASRDIIAGGDIGTFAGPVCGIGEVPVSG